MNSYQKNDVVRLSIQRCGNDGEGIAHLDGQVVFVAGGIPGEVCDVQLLKIGKTALWGRTAKVVEPSPHRLTPDCPHFPKCGGCRFRHMSYEAELDAKRQRVEDALKRIGGVDLPVSVICGSKNTERYRNKVQLPVSAGPAIGFYRARSHDVVNVDDCLLQPRAASAACGAVRAWMTRYGVTAYDEAAHKGLVRHVFLRFSATHVLCCLVANGEKLPHADALIAALREAVPELSGVVLSENTHRTNVVLGTRQRTLWGDDYLDDTLRGLTFRVSVPSFYQVNRDQTEVLYGKVLEFAALTGTETVLDLYCGIGTISLCLAQGACAVIGAEVIPSAVEDARENAVRNGVPNARFICADAGEAAARLALDGVRPDVICVDPPRKGLSGEVIDAMAEMSPRRIVYVSCDPATLARDVRRLAGHGYQAVQAAAVDMFPRTGHVETVIELCRK